MFAIAFDLVVGDTRIHHPRGVTQAYNDILKTLEPFDFRRIQGSLYVTDKDDLANVFRAVQALKSTPWFPKSVKDIRVFRIEQWSDFTSLVKN